jgi:hypothetical protein
MAGTFEGLSDIEWKLFADLFPPELVKRGRGMPHPLSQGGQYLALRPLHRQPVV